MLTTSFFENSFKFFLPEFFLLSSILVVTLYGSIFSAANKFRFPLINMAFFLVSIFILIITCFFVLLNKNIIKVVVHGVFIYDNFSQISKILLLFSAILYLILSLSYTKSFKMNSFEYPLLILLSILGFMLLCSSYDLLSIYLTIELQSLCLYILAAFNRESAYSTEAGLKYFILGAFSSGLLLFGISIIYGFTGTTNLEDLRLLFCLGLAENISINIGIVFLTSAFFFKIAAAPFHLWSPDIYDGAPANSSFFFATVPKIPIILIIIRLYLFCFGAQPEIWQQFFAYSAFLSVIIGSFLALKQRKLKRLLAYSSIGHIGYLLLGIAASGIESLHATFLYLFVYTITSLGIWSLVISLNSCNSSKQIATLSDFSFMSYANPLLGFSGVLLLFSLAGIPPLSGFYVKFCIFIAAINSSFYTLSLLILITSVVSTYYYIRLVKIICFEAKLKRTLVYSISKEVALGLSSLSSILFFLFINPNFLWLFGYKLSLLFYF